MGQKRFLELAAVATVGVCYWLGMRDYQVVALVMNLILLVGILEAMPILAKGNDQVGSNALKHNEELSRQIDLALHRLRLDMQNLSAQIAGDSERIPGYEWLDEDKPSPSR